MNLAITTLFTSHPILSTLVLIWSLMWKGWALWRAAQLEHKYWFIAILVVNTFGLLEILYLYTVARKYTVEVLEN